MSKKRAGAEAKRKDSSGEPPPVVVAPRRKRPLVLALMATLLTAWLVFLAVMAYG